MTPYSRIIFLKLTVAQLDPPTTIYFYTQYTHCFNFHSGSNQSLCPNITYGRSVRTGILVARSLAYSKYVNLVSITCSCQRFLNYFIKHVKYIIFTYFANFKMLVATQIYNDAECTCTNKQCTTYPSYNTLPKLITYRIYT
jgi:hypothetical protein